MRRYAASYRFGRLVTYEDGTPSNFEFDDYEDARFAWRYPDLTAHVLYTARVVEHTIRTEMADEARILVIFQLAQERLKDVVEMPDQDANRIIRAVKENGWSVSGKLRKTIRSSRMSAWQRESWRPFGRRLKTEIGKTRRLSPEDNIPRQKGRTLWLLAGGVSPGRGGGQINALAQKRKKEPRLL